MRLRRGAAASAQGAPRLFGEAIATARRAGATGTIIVRAYYNRDVVTAAHAGGARFSITARMDTVEERLAFGEEDIPIEMVIEIKLDEDLSAELQREVEAAPQED
ncbi:hypothetical protein CRM73_02565 [Kocuria sp. CCUG 69068]|nr:hypothetical protein [Kocuria sp. CCUG 69068]